MQDASNWTLSQYELGGLLQWAALVLIKVMRGSEHIGYVFVIDKKFGDKAKYKMPGGHGRYNETPHMTAVREALGESGVVASNLMLVDKWKEGHGEKEHWKFLFVGEIPERQLERLNALDEGNEGEDSEFFTLHEFDRLVRDKKFLGDHYRQLTYTKLIKPILKAA